VRSAPSSAPGTQEKICGPSLSPGVSRRARRSLGTPQILLHGSAILGESKSNLRRHDWLNDNSSEDLCLSEWDRKFKPESSQFERSGEPLFWLQQLQKVCDPPPAQAGRGADAKSYAYLQGAASCSCGRTVCNFARSGSNQARSTSFEPRSSGASSTVNPGESVAISKRMSPGSL